MDIADLTDEKPTERDPFGFLMTVDGPVEASLGATFGAPATVAVAAGATPALGSALTAEELEQLTADMVAALKTVFDPEIPADIYELGLIYKIDVDDDRNVARLPRGRQDAAMGRDRGHKRYGRRSGEGDAHLRPAVGQGSLVGRSQARARYVLKRAVLRTNLQAP